jgi:hypothetical protein
MFIINEFIQSVQNRKGRSQILLIRDAALPI